MSDLLDQLNRYSHQLDDAIEIRAVDAAPWSSADENGEIIVVDLKTDEQGAHPGRRYLALAVVVIVAIAMTGAAIVLNDRFRTDTSDPATPTGPPGAEQVIRSYIDAYNAGDLDAVLGWHADDARIVNHPEGPFSIESAEDRLTALAADIAEGYVIARLEVNGDEVTWDHRWTGESDQRWCVAGMTAHVQDGSITDLSLPNGESCRELESTVEAYAIAFLTGDVEQVMAFFSEDASMTGFGTAVDGAPLDRDGVRATVERDMPNTSDLEFTKIDVIGATVTFDHVWTNSLNQDFCGTGYEVRVVDGLIGQWDWAPSDDCR